jgi:hypothetical protein
MKYLELIGKQYTMDQLNIVKHIMSDDKHPLNDICIMIQFSKLQKKTDESTGGLGGFVDMVFVDP